MHLIIPKNYNPVLNLRDTEIAIKLVKDFFETELARALNLTRVSAPIMVTPGSGLNDNLNGVERPVSFDVLETGETAEIVHSLAKWKRQALKTYGFQPGEGLYTDMNAIRRDETTDNIHSIFVDQWDWEKIITPKQRTMETLQATVRAIYLTLRKTEGFVCAHYPHIKPELPDDITFVSSQELEDLYPDLPPKEREYRAVREYGAVFLTGIGGALLAMFQFNAHAKNFTTAMTYEILLIVVIGGIGSVSGSCIASFLYIACSEWWLRFLDNEAYIGAFKVPLLRNGFRMVVFSVIIMIVVLFFRKGIMGERELPDLFGKRAKKAKKNVVEEGKADA